MNMMRRILKNTVITILAIAMVLGSFPVIALSATPHPIDGMYAIGNNGNVFVAVDRAPVDRILVERRLEGRATGGSEMLDIIEVGTTVTVRSTLAPILEILTGVGGVSLHHSEFVRWNDSVSEIWIELNQGDSNIRVPEYSFTYQSLGDWHMTPVDEYELTYTFTTPGIIHQVWAAGGWTWNMKIVEPGSWNQYGPVVPTPAPSLSPQPTPVPTPTPTQPPLIINNTSNDIWVFVDGVRVIFPDQQPIIVNNRTLVPVRGVFEMLGYTVYWSEATRSAMLHRGKEQSITIPSGGTNFTSTRDSGRTVQTITPDVPQQIINGRMMLPLRAISEVMDGVSVEWDGRNRAVIITTSSGPSSTPLPVQTPSPTPTATPSPSPAPTATPTPPPATGTSQYWRDIVEATRSSILLPNRRLSDTERADWIAEYESLGGPNAFELEVVRLVNEIRAEHGLAQ